MPKRAILHLIDTIIFILFVIIDDSLKFRIEIF